VWFSPTKKIKRFNDVLSESTEQSEPSFKNVRFSEEESDAQATSRASTSNEVPPPLPPPRHIEDLSSNGKPMIITPHGPINEQLAALIPNYNQQGTLDSYFAAQWAGTNAI
jgi:hypothetical protein